METNFIRLYVTNFALQGDQILIKCSISRPYLQYHNALCLMFRFTRKSMLGIFSLKIQNLKCLFNSISIDKVSMIWNEVKYQANNYFILKPFPSIEILTRFFLITLNLCNFVGVLSDSTDREFSPWLVIHLKIYVFIIEIVMEDRRTQKHIIIRKTHFFPNLG